jgi:hypothetical protein
MDAGAVPLFVQESLDGLEEVHVGAQQPVDAPELRVGGLGRKAVMPDPGPDDRPVLLLDVGTVILSVGTAAREGDLLSKTVVQQRAATLCVQPDRRAMPETLPRPTRRAPARA